MSKAAKKETEPVKMQGVTRPDSTDTLTLREQARQAYNRLAKIHDLAEAIDCRIHSNGEAELEGPDESKELSLLPLAITVEYLSNRLEQVEALLDRINGSL